MARVTIAMADIVQEGMHFLQHRSHAPNKPAANLIGFFGGKVEEEDNESFLEAIAREIGEETTLEPQLSDFTRLGTFATELVHNDKVIVIEGECFRIEVPPGVIIDSREGDIVRIPNGQLPRYVEVMSPATVEVVTKYYDKEIE